MFDMIRQMQQVKVKMAQFQKELENQFFTGTAGNGTVSMTMNGRHEIRKVVIDPQVSGDVEKLQGLIQDAANDAGRQVNEKLKAEVGKMTGGLNLPGLF